MKAMLTPSLGRRNFAKLAAAIVALGQASEGKAAARASGDRSALGASSRSEIAAWDELIDRVRAAGRDLLSSPPSDDAVDRAEGLRYLARFLGRSITDAMAAAEVQPIVRLNSNDISKAGLDASECRYCYAMLDRKGVYRVRGTIGSAQYISLQLIGLVDAQNDRVSGGQSINQFALRTDPEGAFELMIAAEQPTGWNGPWLRFSDNDNSVFTREYFDDWENTKPSRFYIERVDPVSQNAIDEAKAISISGMIAKDFSLGLKQWNATIGQIKARATNQILPARSEHANGGQDELAYCQGSFKLEPNEALLVEMEAPDAHSWSAQLGNLWWESLDYTNHLSSLTAHYAVRSSDGRYRIVIAQTDPGVVNWLDTVGHADGSILFRFFLPKVVPELRVQKISLADLSTALPQDTRRVTPEERMAAINLRRRHVMVRLAP